MDAGLKPTFVLADEVYGNDSKFRRFLEDRDQPFVVAVSSQQRLWITMTHQRVDKIVPSIPLKGWFRMSVADGAKGPRVYDWAAAAFGTPIDTGLVRRLLVQIAWPQMNFTERIPAWSAWRRRHQAIARHGHYRTRKRETQL